MRPFSIVFALREDLKFGAEFSDCRPKLYLILRAAAGGKRKRTLSRPFSVMPKF